MKYYHIEKRVMIPRTERSLFFEFSNYSCDTSVSLYFNPPFTYRGFELTCKLMWISFGINWDIPF